MGNMMNITKARGENWVISFHPGEMILIEKEHGTSAYPFLSNALKETASYHSDLTTIDHNTGENAPMGSVLICDPDTTTDEKVEKLEGIEKCAGYLLTQDDPNVVLTSLEDDIYRFSPEIENGSEPAAETNMSYPIMVVLITGSSNLPSDDWLNRMKLLALKDDFVFIMVVRCDRVGQVDLRMISGHFNARGSLVNIANDFDGDRFSEIPAEPKSHTVDTKKFVSDFKKKRTLKYGNQIPQKTQGAKAYKSLTPKAAHRPQGR